MSAIHFELIQSQTHECIALIGEWYLREWNIPWEKSVEKIRRISQDNIQFQLLMHRNQEPLATGGLYHQVGLLEQVPRLKVYQHWLALVYTKPEYRNQGLGAILCSEIERIAKTRGITTMHLYTHTAENLYRRLGWEAIERIPLKGKNIVVMKKEL